MATLKDVEKNRIIQAELSYGNKNLVFCRPKDVLLKKGTKQCDLHMIQL